MGIAPVHFHLYRPEDMKLEMGEEKILATFNCCFCGRPIVLPWEGGWNAVSVGCGGQAMHIITILKIALEEGEEWRAGGAG